MKSREKGKAVEIRKSFSFCVLDEILEADKKTALAQLAHHSSNRE